VASKPIVRKSDYTSSGNRIREEREQTDYLIWILHSLAFDRVPLQAGVRDTRH
jgi:hypothetical protein